MDNENRKYNVGNSNYSKHSIQPWDVWIEYALNPFDADIVKRVLRRKKEGDMTPQESRVLDYNKIIHICKERIDQIERGLDPWDEFVEPSVCTSKEKDFPKGAKLKDVLKNGKAYQCIKDFWLYNEKYLMAGYKYIYNDGFILTASGDIRIDLEKHGGLDFMKEYFKLH